MNPLIRKLQFKKAHSRAFTLVELLVVIAIVGLLSSVAVVSLTGARLKARNAKRLADIKQLYNAFEIGLSANGSTPSTGGDVWVCASPSCGGGWAGFVANATVDAFLAPYLPNKPVDPIDSTRGYNGYVYNGAWVGASGFSAGSYLTFLLEPSGTCTLGSYFGSTSYYVQCMLKID